MQKIVHFMVPRSHVNLGYFRRAGFTAIIEDFIGDKVRVQVSFCSKRDQFSRKKGREAASKAAVIEIPIKHLPKVLNSFKAGCYKNTSSDYIDPMYYKIALNFALQSITY